MAGVAALGAGQAFAQTSDVDALDRALFANPSATAVLQAWCDQHRPGEKVRAAVIRRESRSATADQAKSMGLGAGDPLAYRRVQLMCGDTVLSEADNWYVPTRLTPAMNEALAGDAPFGVVVRPLAPSRRNLSSERTWEGKGADEILRHHALLLADGRVFSEVIEIYQRAMLIPR